MGNARIAALSDRVLVRISGDDASHFLQGLVTCDVENLEPGQAAFGALLSPQGKVMFDFFVIGSIQGYLIDISASLEDDFMRRLTFYKLRAKVEIGPMDKRTSIHAAWGGEVGDVDGICVTDPRLAAMGQRLYCRKAPELEPGDYHEHRIALGMPQGGEDYVFGDCFPHEVLMDQFGGVDFAKGCYVGQEVVSRMQHRGTARNRIIKVSAQAALPSFNTDILAGGKPAGEMGSSRGKKGLAMLRLDRVARAVSAGGLITVGSLVIEPEIQEWARFTWPQEEE
ncbi:MAG: folate-binding protein [Nitratireductor sp.]